MGAVLQSARRCCQRICHTPCVFAEHRRPRTPWHTSLARAVPPVCAVGCRVVARIGRISSSLSVYLRVCVSVCVCVFACTWDPGLRSRVCVCVCVLFGRPKDGWDCSVAPEELSPPAFLVLSFLFLRFPTCVCLRACVCVRVSACATAMAVRCFCTDLRTLGRLQCSSCAPVSRRKAHGRRWPHAHCFFFDCRGGLTRCMTRPVPVCAEAGSGRLISIACTCVACVRVCSC